MKVFELSWILVGYLSYSNFNITLRILTRERIIKIQKYFRFPSITILQRGLPHIFLTFKLLYYIGAACIFFFLKSLNPDMHLNSVLVYKLLTSTCKICTKVPFQMSFYFTILLTRYGLLWIHI